jgi:hypothetical protein
MAPRIKVARTPGKITFVVSRYSGDIRVDISEVEHMELLRDALRYLGNFVYLSDEGDQWLNPLSYGTPITSTNDNEPTEPQQLEVQNITAANPNIRWVDEGVDEDYNQKLTALIRRKPFDVRLVANIKANGKTLIGATNIGTINPSERRTRFLTLDDLTLGEFH